jgi:hypothetical protein
METHGVVLVALHWHPEPAETATATTVAPGELSVALPGEIAKVHTGAEAVASWVMVTT